jgi:hypothetical protein
MAGDVMKRVFALDEGTRLGRRRKRRFDGGFRKRQAASPDIKGDR